MSCTKDYEDDLSIVKNFASSSLSKKIEMYGFWEYARGALIGDCTCNQGPSCARKRTDLSELMLSQIRKEISEITK